MEVREAILRRTSVRKWEEKKVEREKIVKLLEAARRAPSWGNLQPWRFIVIEDKESIRKLAVATGGQRVVDTAPVVIVCGGYPEDFSREKELKSIKELSAVGALEALNLTEEQMETYLNTQSPAALGPAVRDFRTREQIIIAMAYMTLAAVDQGLGACWIGGFDAEQVRKDLKVPSKIVIHALLALGYPGEFPSPRPRKSLEEIAFFEKYSE